MRLALFDFDGTITTNDSLIDFLQFAVGKRGYYGGLLKLTPTLIPYTLKLISNDRAKERLIAHYFQGWERDKFQAIANQYALEEIEKIVRPQAIEKIRWHQAAGDRVVIVSASMECWLKPWCDREGIELLSTQLEFVDEKLSGKFKSNNCYGKEKENRIKAYLNLAEYNHIYAYGDSTGDKELLALANESHFRPFR